MRYVFILLIVLQAATLNSLATAKPPNTAARTPLDEYIQKPDAVYGWKVGQQAAVYGFWATAIGNYYERQILQRSDRCSGESKL